MPVNSVFVAGGCTTVKDGSFDKGSIETRPENGIFATQPGPNENDKPSWHFY